MVPIQVIAHRTHLERPVSPADGPFAFGKADIVNAFQLATDNMGRALPVPPPCSMGLAVILTAGTPRLIAVPTNARLVLFNATQAFWARFGMAVTLPTVDILDGTAPELNPAGRRLDGISQIGLVAATDSIVNLLFYR